MMGPATFLRQRGVDTGPEVGGRALGGHVGVEATVVHVLDCRPEGADARPLLN
jgi:hypothetical protein